MIPDAVSKQITDSPVSKKCSDEVNQLVLMHREIAKKIAHRMLASWGAQIPPEEFDSNVDLALCEAALRYRPEKETCFSTFLYYYIRGRLTDAIAKSSQRHKLIVSMANSQAETLSDFSDSQDHLDAPLGDLETIGILEPETPETQLERNEIAGIVRQACYSLDPQERELLNRIFVECQTIPEITREIGRPKSKVISDKDRALDHLKEILKSQFDIDGS